MERVDGQWHQPVQYIHTSSSAKIYMYDWVLHIYSACLEQSFHEAMDGIPRAQRTSMPLLYSAPI